MKGSQLLIRRLEELLGTEQDVHWGNGTSRRLLVAGDGRGSTLTDTFIQAETETLLRYDNHLESCYCVEGGGSVICAGVEYDIAPGTLYAPDKGEEHSVIAGPDGMRLICLFNPPLTGAETHRLTPGEPSGY
jgi:L-ectoine synthase